MIQQQIHSLKKRKDNTPGGRSIRNAEEWALAAGSGKMRVPWLGAAYTGPRLDDQDFILFLQKF